MDPAKEDNIVPARGDIERTTAADPDDENLKVEEETARVIDHVAERRLCRKFDVRLMPVLAIMCMCPTLLLSFVPRFTANFSTDLFNALDKGNLGYAQTAGLSDGMPHHLRLPFSQQLL